MRGLTISSLRHHYALVPLFGAVGFGCLLAGVYTLRLATRNPAVSWRRRSNPEPWQSLVDSEGRSVRYTLFASPESPMGNNKFGVKAFPDERPPIEKWWADYQEAHPEKAHH